MESTIGLGGRIRTPFRDQPRLIRWGQTLVLLCVVLLGIALPLHVAVASFVFSPDRAGHPWWHWLLAIGFLSAFLSFGTWMVGGFIRAAYEPKRPALWVALLIAGTAAAQIALTSAGLGRELLFAEVLGMPACAFGGAIISNLGEEVQHLRRGHSAGGGIGGLAGLILGFVYLDNALLISACALAGGLLAEGIGRAIGLLFDWRPTPPPRRPAEDSHDVGAE